MTDIKYSTIQITQLATGIELLSTMVELLKGKKLEAFLTDFENLKQVNSKLEEIKAIEATIIKQKQENQVLLEDILIAQEKSADLVKREQSVAEQLDYIRGQKKELEKQVSDLNAANTKLAKDLVALEQEKSQNVALTAKLKADKEEVETLIKEYKEKIKKLSEI